MSDDTNSAKPPGKRNLLGALQTARLINYTEAHYRGSRQTNQQFALRASEALGFLVNANNVDGARRSLGLPCEFTVRAEERAAERAAKAAAKAKGQPSPQRLIDRVVALEAAVAAMAARVDSLVSDLGGDQPPSANGKAPSAAPGRAH